MTEFVLKNELFTKDDKLGVALSGGAWAGAVDYTCPDCGRKIYLFGQGKTAEAAKAHKLPLLAEMPIDPALAALTDAGDIESFQGSWLDGAADRLENK